MHKDDRFFIDYLTGKEGVIAAIGMWIMVTLAALCACGVAVGVIGLVKVGLP